VRQEVPLAEYVPAEQNPHPPVTGALPAIHTVHEYRFEQDTQFVGHEQQMKIISNKTKVVFERENFIFNV